MPQDIVYVHDFDHPEAPRPLVLPAGAGPALVEDMNAAIERLQAEIPAVIEEDEFKRSQSELAAELEAKNRAAIVELESLAKTFGFGVRPMHGGVQTFPILHGKPLSAEQFGVLDESTKRALSQSEEKLTREVDKTAQVVRAQNARFEAAREEAFSKAAAVLIDSAVKELERAFGGLGEEIRSWLERVRQALVEDWDDLVEVDDEEEREQRSRDEREDPELATRLNRFRVNLLVSHEPEARAPVIYDTNPTYPSLFGYLERRARFGALLTDFTRIRAGSLHKASGGVLVVRAADLLLDPIIWERMKRVLREQRIGAEDPLGPLGLYATSLRPVPVPVHVRVVLVGPPDLYATLLEADPDFASLFRVKVEVDPIIPRSPKNLAALDAYLMAMAGERQWGAFDREARAELLDLATRLSGDRSKLALILSPLEETMAFASALAAAQAADDLMPRAGNEDEDATHVPPRPFRASIAPPPVSVVGKQDIQGAWLERRDRAGSAERHIREITLRGEVALDTSGSRAGVVNGLQRLQRRRRRVRAADANYCRRGYRTRGDHRRRARGAARRQHPHQGRRHPPRLPRPHVRARATAQLASAAGLRAELRRGRWRQRELERALRRAERAGRRRDRPGYRRHRQREPARRDAGDRRGLRQDRGLLRPLCMRAG